MIRIERLPEPEILKKKKEKWLALYLQKLKDTPGARPPSGKYAHREIRETLESMSFHKCFFCDGPFLSNRHIVFRASLI